MNNISKYRNINGITCYINSILHIIYQTPILIDYILKYGELYEEKSLTYNLYILFKSTRENKNAVIQPNLFYSVIGNISSQWKELKQQDSSEFLIFVLDYLQIESNKNNKLDFKSLISIDNKKFLSNNVINNLILNYNHSRLVNENTKDITMLFKGYLKMLKKCTICNTQSYNYDILHSLKLSIPNDKNSIELNDILNNYFNKEELECKCNFCNLSEKIYGEPFLLKTPSILIIDFKRFTNCINKINTEIIYPEYLDLNKFVTVNVKNHSYYRLFAVNIHKGFTPHKGHYTSIIKNLHDSEWYYYDDEMVKKINFFQHSNAYILFYCKVNKR